MIYSYSPLAGDSESSLAVYPLVPVMFIYKHQIINYTLKALVDSGAESCYCLMTIGDYLRIDFRHKKTITSTAANNSKFTGYLEPVNLLVSGKKITEIYKLPNSPWYPGQSGRQLVSLAGGGVGETWPQNLSPATSYARRPNTPKLGQNYFRFR